MPGCQEKAEHKAPKNRGLNEYHHFCLVHVQEYNKAWNFFEGMNDDETYDHMMKSHYGDRPTWKFDGFDRFEDNLRRHAHRGYHGFDAGEAKAEEERERAKRANFSGISQHSKEYQAMMIMGLSPPLEWDEIKSKYKELVKKHHPDLNPGDKDAEDLLKSINMAYTILKLAYETYAKMQEKDKT